VGGEARVRALTSAVDSAQQGLDAAQASYRYGLRSNVDILRSQDILFRTCSQLVDARLDYLRGIAGLHEATGQLTDVVLDQMSETHLLRP